MNNVQTVASAIPTLALAKEAGRRLTQPDGLDIKALKPATREALLAAQSRYAEAIRAAREELVNEEIKFLVAELGLANA